MLASCGSVKWEINRKCASLVTPEICRGVGVERRGTGFCGWRHEEPWRSTAWFFYDHLFCFFFLLLFFPLREKFNQMPFKRKNNYSFNLAASMLSPLHFFSSNSHFSIWIASRILAIHIEKWKLIKRMLLERNLNVLFNLYFYGEPCLCVDIMLRSIYSCIMAAANHLCSL